MLVKQLLTLLLTRTILVNQIKSRISHKGRAATPIKIKDVTMEETTIEVVDSEVEEEDQVVVLDQFVKYVAKLVTLQLIVTTNSTPLT